MEMCDMKKYKYFKLITGKYTHYLFQKLSKRSEAEVKEPSF